MKITDLETGPFFIGGLPLLVFAPLFLYINRKDDKTRILKKRKPAAKKKCF